MICGVYKNKFIKVYKNIKYFRFFKVYFKSIIYKQTDIAICYYQSDTNIFEIILF